MSSTTRGQLMSTIFFENDTKKCKKLLKSANMLQLPILRGKYNILKMAMRLKRVKLAELFAKNCIEIRHKKLDRSSNTLLHDAVRLGQLKVVRILVSRGADVNATIRNGMTPLHVAAKHGYLKIMEFLISNGAHVNARYTGHYGYGFTPLHFTCKSNNLKCAKLLLKHNASVIPANVDDCRPIDITVNCLSFKMTQLLLDYGASMTVNKLIRIEWETEITEANDVEYLTLLQYIVIRRSLPMAQLFLKYGADVNIKSTDGICPLADAIMDHNIQMVKLLLNNGAHLVWDDSGTKVDLIDCIFFTRLGVYPYYCKSQYSLVDKKLEIIKLLIDAGVSIKSSERPSRILHHSIWHGFRKIVNYLLYHTDFNFYNLNDVVSESAAFNERLIPQFSEIANDTEYLTKRKLECKELTYDVIADKYSRHLIGLPVDHHEISYEYLTRLPTRFEVTKEEHEDRIKKIKNNIQGVLDEMKREKIGDSNITFFDILTSDMDKIIKFASNGNFRALCIDNYKEKYFIYFNKLKSDISYAVKKSLSIETCNKLVYSLFKNVLPYDCCEEIVTYLDCDEFISKFNVDHK